MKIHTLLEEIMPELTPAQCKAAAGVLTKFVPDKVPDDVAKVMRSASTALRALGLDKVGAK